jgi:hypothetical protein
MACLCEQVAGTGIELSPTCIGHLWIFQNLELSRSAQGPFDPEKPCLQACHTIEWRTGDA